MDSNSQYYFCFSLQKMQLAQGFLQTLQMFTHYRFGIFRNERQVGTTKEFLCAPNEHLDIILQQEEIHFKFNPQYQSLHKPCELRLFQISQEASEKLVGCYQFLLSNYVKAYQQLNRNCVELNVQISCNFIIHYAVFVEKTSQALRRIIREHQTARKFQMQEDAISEIETFLPHEITNENLEEIFREIKISEEASPLLLSQRYWSPKRKPRPASRNSSLLSKTSEKVMESSTLTVDSNRLSFLRVNKSFSSASHLDPNKVWKFNKSASNIQQLDIESQPETEDNKFIQLYEVIKSDSKIILPEQLQEHSERMEEDHADKKDKRMKRSLRKYDGWIKQITLIAFLIVILAFFLFLFERPSLAVQRKARRH